MYPAILPGLSNHYEGENALTMLINYPYEVAVPLVGACSCDPEQVWHSDLHLIGHLSRKNANTAPVRRCILLIKPSSTATTRQIQSQSTPQCLRCLWATVPLREVSTIQTAKVA